MTLEEAQANLATVNAAIQTIVEGKRVLRLEVREAGFLRVKENQEVTLDALRAYRNELLLLIGTLQTTPVAPTFRQFATIPLIVNKGDL
jgi:hypothetical protein